MLYQIKVDVELLDFTEEKKEEMKARLCIYVEDMICKIGLEQDMEVMSDVECALERLEDY